MWGWVRGVGRCGVMQCEKLGRQNLARSAQIGRSQSRDSHKFCSRTHQCDIVCRRSVNSLCRANLPPPTPCRPRPRSALQSNRFPICPPSIRPKLFQSAAPDKRTGRTGSFVRRAAVCVDGRWAMLDARCPMPDARCSMSDDRCGSRSVSIHSRYHRCLNSPPGITLTDVSAPYRSTTHARTHAHSTKTLKFFSSNW